MTVGCRPYRVARSRELLDKRSFSMRVSPYYSANQSDPDVHHNQSDCPSGQQIPAYNRRPGTNGWPLCKHCADM